MMHSTHARLREGAIPLLWLCANGALILAQSLYTRGLGMFVLAGALPGWLLLGLLYRRDRLELDEAFVLAGGLALAALLLGGLLLHAIPGPLSRWQIALAYNGLLVPLYIARRRWEARVRIVRPGKAGAALLVALVLAAAFRFPHLDYSEFQGDEVAVVHMAASAVQGRDEAFYLHRKGPGEALIPMLTYAVAHRMNEAVARFPFALASLWSVLAIYTLGRRFLSTRAGLWAALLWALNGFSVAFGRIVQYQGLVIFCGALSIYCACAYAQDRRRRDLWLCALFAALGLLAHSDAVFAVTTAALVILFALGRERAPVRGWAGRLAGPALLGGVLLAAFYAPYWLHPYAAEARAYLGTRLGSPPVDNLGYLVEIATVYNSVYYLGSLAIGLVIMALRALRHFHRLRWALLTVAVVLLAQSWFSPSTWQIGSHSYVGAIYIVVLALWALALKAKPYEMALLFWFALPFVGYMFLFGDPRTHVYTIFPGATLLVGEGLTRCECWLSRRRWLAQGAVYAAMIISAGYLLLMFINHNPEYRRTYPQYRVPLYWTPWGERMPQKGLFGFPYRAGWKVSGSLYETGVLQGDYDSNEEAHITNWYTRSAPWCGSAPHYYFVAKNVQDVQPLPVETIAHDYTLVGRVWVGDEAKIEIYERQPAALAYQDYRLADYASRFDSELSTLSYAPTVRVVDPLWDRQHATDLRLGDDVTLLGYTIDREVARPGEVVTVTLYWRALRTIQESYAAFVHVEADGVVWAQKDCAPSCGRWPTTGWKEGDTIRDPHPILLGANTPAGEYALIAGMYAHATIERLAVLGMEGIATDQVTLGALSVIAP